MAADSKSCSIPGCKRSIAHSDGGRQGMCAGHYTRWRRHGDPLHGGDIGERAYNGEVMAYLLDHMWDDCPKWPFARNDTGYGKVNLGGDNRAVHRLVCDIVNGPPPSSDHEAAHNCGKGHLGCFGARCLAWKTTIDNHADMRIHGTMPIGEKSPNAKLTEEQAREILARAKNGESQRSLAKEFGVMQSVVSNIKLGRRWAHIRSGDSPRD